MEMIGRKKKKKEKVGERGREWQRRTCKYELFVGMELLSDETLSDWLLEVQ